MQHTKHGKCGSSLYNSWSNMIQRCTNPKHPSYSRYGGRGITVCTSWMTCSDFVTWAVDNGYRVGLSIERIDNNGNYEPSNCRWASRKDQQRNRGVNHVVEYKGETRCLTEWAEILGMEPKTLEYRLTRSGMTVHDAFNLPVHRHRTGAVQATSDDGTVTVYRNASDAARALGVSSSSGISLCLSGKTKSAYGRSWNYVYEES